MKILNLVVNLFKKYMFQNKNKHTCLIRRHFVLLSCTNDSRLNIETVYGQLNCLFPINNKKIRRVGKHTGSVSEIFK